MLNYAHFPTSTPVDMRGYQRIRSRQRPTQRSENETTTFLALSYHTLVLCGKTGSI